MPLERSLALVDHVGLRWVVSGARATGDPDRSRSVVRGFRRLIRSGGDGSDDDGSETEGKKT